MRLTIVLACATALTASAAFAQDNLDDDMDMGSDARDVDVDVNVTQTPPPAPPAPVTITRTPGPAPFDDDLEPDLGDYFNRGDVGSIKVMAGSGDFTQANAMRRTGIGPQWEARASFGGDSPVGFEAAYVGSARDMGRVNGAEALVSNGAEADLRLAIPIEAREDIDFRPFAFGGVGWQYMTMWGDGPVDGARDRGDHIMQIPAGVGLEIGVGPVAFDVRGTYRHAFDSELFGNAQPYFNDPDALHSYSVTGGLGIDF